MGRLVFGRTPRANHQIGASAILSIVRNSKT